MRLTLKEKARDLLQAAHGRPIAYSHQADATSTLCSETAVSRDGTTTRKGKVLMEFLIERPSLILRRADGNSEAVIMLRPPRLLTEGISCWVLRAASCECFPLLRMVGHTGICVYHAVNDRAVCEPCILHWKERINAFHMGGLGPNLEERELHRNLDWLVHSACAHHDASKALQWSVRASSSEERLKELRIAVESLRNSFSLLVAKLPSFLVQHRHCG